MARMTAEQRDTLIQQVARAMVREQGQAHPDPDVAVSMRRADANIAIEAIEETGEWAIVWLNPEGITA